MLDRETVIRLAREAANSGDGSELSGDAIERFAQLVFLHAARQEPAKRQYYYKMNGCRALNPLDPKCICWHDEGTGPVPSMDPEMLEWRDAPKDGVKATDEVQQDDTPARALARAAMVRTDTCEATTRRAVTRRCWRSLATSDDWSSLLSVPLA